MSVLEDFAQAIKDGDSALLDSLLASGSIDANARLPLNRNPPALVAAAQSGHKDVVDVLLRFGARINDTDDDGRTACHVVFEFLAAEALALLARAASPISNSSASVDSHRLMFHLFDGLDHDMRMSAMLIEAGVDLARVVDQRRLCQVAALSTSAIQKLLRNGVAVNELRDNRGRTALHLAVGAANGAPVLEMLMHVCGVELEARTSSGSTCLHVACFRTNADAIRLFILAGANLRAIDNSGRTPLHIFSEKNCTILLLAAGADVHARDQCGKTPLMALATYFGNGIGMRFVHPRVNVLLAGGADLDVADHDGNTARQVLLAEYAMTFDDAQTSDEVEAARREIAKVRLDYVRHRAWQVCIGLQSRGLDALQMCEILLHACGPVAPVIAFHQWWKIATTVKHFKSKSNE
jgi:ankyrin repeat protein